MSAQQAITSLVDTVKQQHADNSGVQANVINIADFQDPSTHSATRNLSQLRSALTRAGMAVGLFSTKTTGDGQYELRTAPMGA